MAFPDWVEKYRGPGLEIKKKGNNYYLSKYKTVYDSQTKKPKKITLDYLGKITQDGLIKPKRRLREEINESMVSYPLEYGASCLLESLGNDIYENLKKYFPKEADAIFTLGKIGLIEPSPMKRKSLIYHHSYDTILHPDLALSSSSLTELLKSIGSNRKAQVDFMKQYLLGKNYIIFDGTRLVSYSSYNEYAHVGYNHCNIENPQVNVLYCFSLSPQKAPVYFRANAGDKTDYETILNAIKETNIKNVVFIADKGFGSDYNFDFFKANELKYLIPLRRNDTSIDSTTIHFDDVSTFDGYFVYHERIIYYKVLSDYETITIKKEVKKGPGRPKKNPTQMEEIQYQTKDCDLTILYFDEELKHMETKDYNKRIIKHFENYSVEEYVKQQRKMGTITLRANFSSTAEQMYLMYKEREIIEDSNKAYKNVLDIGASCLQDKISYTGWLFLNHISLMLYYRIFNRLKEKNCINSISVEDVIAYLKRVTKQKIDNHWIVETGTKTQLNKIIDLFPEYNTQI